MYIELEDENDHPPIFTRKLYIGGVTEDTKIFSSVLKIVVSQYELLSFSIRVHENSLTPGCQILLLLLQHLLYSWGGIHLICSLLHSYISTPIARYISSSISLHLLSASSTRSCDQLCSVILACSQKHGWTSSVIFSRPCGGFTLSRCEYCMAVLCVCVGCCLCVPCLVFMQKILKNKPCTSML